MIIFFLFNIALSTGVQAADMPQSFRKVYPYLEKNCVGCHGSYQAPLFAVSPIESAYKSVEKIRPTVFISQSQNGHCGVENCRVRDLNFEKDVLQWDKDWVKQNGAQKHSLSAPLFPTSQKSQILRWSLRSVVKNSLPADVRVWASVRVRKEEGDFYLVEDLRVFASRGHLKIKGFQFVQSDRPLVLQELQRSLFEMSFDPGHPQSFGVYMKPWHVSLEISKTGLRVTADEIVWRPEMKACGEMESFEKHVLPLLEKRACLDCHEDSYEARIEWDTKRLSPERLCQETRGRINGLDPSNSILFKSATGESLDHGVLIPFPDELDEMKLWIEKEFKR